MEKKKILRTAGLIAGGFFLLWLFIAALLPLLLPFLIAFLLAVVTEPLAKLLMEKAGFPRALAGGLCILAVYLLLGTGLFFLGKFLLQELGELIVRLPEMTEKLAPGLENLRKQLFLLLDKLPEQVQDALKNMTDEAFRGGTGLLGKLPEALLDLVTKLAKKLPDFFLFLLTTVISGFMMAGSLPKLRLWLSRILPRPWRRTVTNLWHRSRGAIGGWLKAELKLSGITFLLVTAGFFLLRVPGPLFLGLLTAVVDFLPVLGAGTILIPWALVLFLQRQTLRAVAFTLLYGVTAVTRTTLEPRILGRQMGLPPLATLFAVYTGYRLAGFWGLLLFPVGLSLVLQLRELTRGDGSAS